VTVPLDALLTPEEACVNWRAITGANFV